MRAFGLLYLMFSFIWSYCQDLNDVERLLTNGTSKEWTLDGIEETLGSSCKPSDITFSFVLSEKKGRIKRCKDLGWENLDFNWSLKQSEGDMIVLFQFKNTASFEDKFIVQFISKANKKYLRLRSAQDDKLQKTKDYLLK